MDFSAEREGNRELDVVDPPDDIHQVDTCQIPEQPRVAAAGLVVGIISSRRPCPSGVLSFKPRC